MVYESVCPGINLLKSLRKELYPYHTPETSINVYHTVRSHVTTDFNVNNLSVIFI